jgi:hypothetical protein
MSLIETFDRAAATANTSPRYRQRRVGDVKAVERRKRAIAKPLDPLAATIGLCPRYYRERAANEKTAAENAAALALIVKPPPPVLWTLHETVQTVNEATSELRRRVTDAEAPERLSRRTVWLLVTGASVLLWLGLGGFAVGLERMAFSVF